MATTQDLDHLHLPAAVASGLCPPSPTVSRPSANNAGDSGHTGDFVQNRLAFLSRTVSTRTQHSQSSHNSHRSRLSHRISIASSHRSVASIRSHVSTFQNVRFDPEPVKDISFWGGLALLISNMSGPGLVALPIVAQSAGWFPTVLGFVIVGMLSSLSSLFICEAMTEVPGNEHFQSNVEFSNLVLCFFGRRYHLLVQIICFLAMQTTNIASIAVSAQLFDNLLIHIFHRTCGIQVYPSVGFVCVTDQLQSASPFTGVMIMTAGILLAFSMILPLGLLKLSENIWIQLVSFTLLILIVLQWIVTFFTHGLTTENVPAIGTDISQVFGTILFNYAFVTTVPSWANAKQPSVSIHKTVNWSVGITTFIYIVVAILGGMAYRVSNDSSLIQAIGSSPDVTVLSQITGYAFPIAALITSIPVNIIVIRYNLVQSGTCNLLWANLCAGVFPWLVAIPCMTGAWLTMIINWSSLFLVSAANFIIPFVLYICSKRYREKLRNLPIIEMEQRERLSREASRSSFSIRNASASGSVRRRITGSSFQSQARGHSHLDLSPTPSIGIAMASVTPVAVGIGSGGFVHPVDPGESQTKEHHRPPSNGPNSATEKGDFSHEPYFSFSRDGELFEHESSVPHSHSLSNRHHPTGSTVILHDPATEIAQRKSSVPRRVSHRDRILSIISDKHKRTMEQQAKIQEEQSEKPVPPIILLSQSIALESENKDDLNIPVEAGLYLQNNTSASSMSEKGHEKDSGMLNVRDQAAKENALESSPTLSSPGSPHKLTVIHPSLSSPERPSPDRENEPARLSASLSVNTSRDALGIESSVTDTSRLGPRTSMTSASARYPSGPESASSVGSVGRRVSFSGDHRLSAPMLSLERKPSFGDETKRLVKAVATLVGGSPVLGGSSHRSTSTKGKPLLGDQREAEEPDEDQDTEDADQDISSPRLTPGGGKHLPMSLNETRRDSMGRMAAAFVAQPGAFSIKTTLAPTEPSGRGSENQADLGTLQGSHEQGETAKRPTLSLSLSPSAPPSSQRDDPAITRSHSGGAHSTLSVKEKTRPSQLFAPESGNSPSGHLAPPSPSYFPRTNSDVSSSSHVYPKGMLPPLTPSAPPSPQKVLSNQPSGSRTTRISGSNKSITAPFQGGYNYSIAGFGSSHSPTSSPLHPPPSPGQQSFHDPPHSAQSVASSWFHWRRHSREPSRSSTSTGMAHSAGSAPPSPRHSMVDATGVAQRYGDRLLEPPSLSPGKETAGALEESTGGDAGHIEEPKNHLDEFNADLYALENGLAYETRWGLRAIPKWIPASGLTVAWTSLIMLLIAITATITYDLVELSEGNNVLQG